MTYNSDQLDALDKEKREKEILKRKENRKWQD